MPTAIIITGMKKPPKVRAVKSLGITKEMADKINKYNEAKLEAKVLNKDIHELGYDSATQIKYEFTSEKYIQYYEKNLAKRVEKQKQISFQKDMEEVLEQLEKAKPATYPSITKEVISNKIKEIKDSGVKGKLVDDVLKELENYERTLNIIRGTTSGVVASNKNKEKTPVSKYKPIVKGLKESLLRQLNKRKWSESRNELIYKIEQMDELKLSQLYYENPELFAIYYYGESDVYIEDWERDRFIYGYTDLVDIYERRFGVIL